LITSVFVIGAAWAAIMTNPIDNPAINRFIGNTPDQVRG